MPGHRLAEQHTGHEADSAGRRQRSARSEKAAKRLITAGNGPRWTVRELHGRYPNAGGGQSLTAGDGVRDEASSGQVATALTPPTYRAVSGQAPIALGLLALGAPAWAGVAAA
jgi:hypothetical protein